MEAEQKYHGKTIEYWKENAEEDYIKAPISVLKYITILEEALSEVAPKEEKCELCNGTKKVELPFKSEGDNFVYCPKCQTPSLRE